MLLIGLTGGIGSGKSTVSAGLAARGAVVIDADAVVRELQQPGQAVFDTMVERFGPDIVRTDGELDRQAVADLVFSDPEALHDLNAIVHPAVGAEIMSRLAAQEGTDHVVVLDVPLLVENESFEVVAVVVVDTDPETAVARLVVHRGFDQADARARMARQASREQRLERADWVVPNDGDRDDLESEIEHLWTWIQGLASSQGDDEASD